MPMTIFNSLHFSWTLGEIILRTKFINQHSVFSTIYRLRVSDQLTRSVNNQFIANNLYELGTIMAFHGPIFITISNTKYQ